MIVVDASALVAIAQGEPERDDLLRALAAASSAVTSTINFVEAGITLVGRGLFKNQIDFEGWLQALRVEVTDCDGSRALATYLQYGKGFHSAGLNLGDCFAYALAKQLDAPLLYKGDDFARTDVRSALQPT